MGRYEVTLLTNGKVTRIVEGKNEQDAIQKVKKMLFDTDGVTPKKNALVAFAWDFPHGFTYGGERGEEDE